MNLNEIKIGQSAKIIEVQGDGKDRQHLLDLGVIPGAIIKAIKRAPMGDPLEISIHDYELAIRNSYAENVIIEVVNDEDLYDLSCKDCTTCKQTCSKESVLAKNTLEQIYNYGTNKKDELINETEHPGLGESGRFHNKKDENPLPEDKKLSFALVGNQNSGKTTLFNVLTNSNQHVGNFPGVTIDRKDGEIKSHKNTCVTDLPGIYSLSPYSSEEIIARDFILKDDVDCIINIVDATNIERGLYLTMQLLQLEHPMVVALNMMDEVSKNNGTILVNKLEQELGVPIVPISAVKNEGIDELIDHAVHIARYQELPLKLDFCDKNYRLGSVHRALHSIMHIIEDHCRADESSVHKHIIPIRFATEKIAEADNLVFDELKLNDEDKQAIEQILKQMERQCSLDRCALIADMRYCFIKRICDKCVVKGNKNYSKKRSYGIDKILTGKWTGIPSFVLIMALIFWLTFNVLGKTLQIWIESLVYDLSNFVSACMQSSDVSPVVQSFVTDGIIAGIGTVASFLPIIVIMFFFLSILEDTGYMARIAFVTDKLLRKIGLSGRSIVPMLIGFGCSVPAIMATRTLPSKRDRKLTILLIPYMSCSAKLPVYAFIVSIFFPENAFIAMLSIYLLGIIVGILIALVLKGKSKPVPFIMELPNYRFPTIKNVGHLLWDKTKDFLVRAFTIILLATIIIWFLQSFNYNFVLVDDASQSILASLSGLLTPLFTPVGLGDWRLITSLVSGFIMKEGIVATMAVLFSGAQEIFVSFSWITAASFLVFCLLYTPCIAAISCVRKELGFRASLKIILFQCFIAWIFSFAVFNILSLIFIYP